MHTFNAEACEQELLREKLGPGEYYAHRYEFVWSISSGLQNGCREVGCQTGILDLALALQNFFTRENPVERWIAGKEVASERNPGKAGEKPKHQRPLADLALIQDLVALSRSSSRRQRRENRLSPDPPAAWFSGA